MSSIEAAVIENELRSVLTSFLVSNFDDMRLLQAMVMKVTTASSINLHENSG